MLIDPFAEDLRALAGIDFLWKNYGSSRLSRLSVPAGSRLLADGTTLLQQRRSNVKNWLTLSAFLSAAWLAWSGYFDQPFLLLLGLMSVVATVSLASRMRIIDDEGTPLKFGLRPIPYAFWLVKEIVLANIDVARRILDPELPIRPKMVCVKANQKTELGRVIHANSITLTPGTVSVDIQNDQIWVHSLTLEGADADSTGDMDRRICVLETGN